jgi:hypothetical protein
LRIPQAKQIFQVPDLGAGVPVSMNDSAADARSVAAVASVSMGVNATIAKSVVEKESVSMGDSAATAKSVEAVASVSMDEVATNAKSVGAREPATMNDDAAKTARRAVALRRGSERKQTVKMFLQTIPKHLKILKNRKSAFRHRQKPYLTRWK